MTSTTPGAESCPIETAMVEGVDSLSSYRQRLRKIRDLQRRLLFEERFMTLRPEERASINGDVTPAMRARLDAAPSEQERGQIISEFARANYFQRIAWNNYLYGHTREKPFDQRAIRRAARQRKKAA